MNEAAYSLIEHSAHRITDLLSDTCAAHADARCTIRYNDSQYDRLMQPLIKLFIMVSRSTNPEDDGRRELSREDAMVVSLLMMRTSMRKVGLNVNWRHSEATSNSTDVYKALRQR